MSEYKLMEVIAELKEENSNLYEEIARLRADVELWKQGNLSALDTVNRLGIKLERLRSENFALAANQCHNIVGDEGGTPVCKEVVKLRAEIIELQENLERMRIYKNKHPTLNESIAIRLYDMNTIRTEET